MSVLRLVVVILCSPLAAAPAFAGHQHGAALEQARAEAWSQYVRRDFDRFVDTMEGIRAEAATTRDLYNLACGYALTGDLARALATLSEVVARGGDFDLQADPDLAALHGDPAFAGLVERATYTRVVSAKLEPTRAKAAAAYDLGRYDAFVAILEVVAPLSNDETDWYNLACGYALLGRTDDAFTLLERLARAHALAANPTEDEDFAVLWGEERFVELTRRYPADDCG